MLQSSNNTPSTSPHRHNIYEKYLNKLNEKNSENVNLAMNSSSSPQTPSLTTNVQRPIAPIPAPTVLHTRPSFSNPLPPPQHESVSTLQPAPQMKKVIKRRLTLGKGNEKKKSKVGVLITNNVTRKNIEKFKVQNKSMNIKTVKNYLKKHNFIKHGTSCPSLLMREMYENIRLCGNVNNLNSQNLINNFMKDDE